MLVMDKEREKRICRTKETIKIKKGVQEKSHGMKHF